MTQERIQEPPPPQPQYQQQYRETPPLPQEEAEEEEQQFDPRSYKSEAINMALNVNDETYRDSSGPTPREICRDVRRHTMSRGYFTIFGLVEMLGTSYGVNRLHGMTNNLRNDEGVATILPLAMDDFASRLNISEDMSPSASLAISTGLVVLGTLLTPQAHIPTQNVQLPEFKEEEDIDDAKAREEKKDDGYLDDKFPE